VIHQCKKLITKVQRLTKIYTSAKSPKLWGFEPYCITTRCLKKVHPFYFFNNIW